VPPRVLIANDAAAMRAALRGLLEDHGLPVIAEAADGLQAVTMAAWLQPDVVVMDVRMPGLDGLQATKRITGAHPTIRVVVYSVFDSDDPARRPPGWRRRRRVADPQPGCAGALSGSAGRTGPAPAGQGRDGRRRGRAGRR
jgi:CheY-like chemotaxis protein